jgi:molybdenum cofactor cytidylyltransferase
LSTSSNIAIVILAAGKSSRMGRAKQLLPWGKSTVLGHAIQQALAAETQDVFVVLGANHKRIEDTLAPTSAYFLINENWQNGLGTSIALAATHLLKSTCAGMLIVLADQPQVDTAFLNKLTQQFRPTENQIVATKYATKTGVPALFSRSYFEELSNLQGDRGASKIIKNSAAFVTTIAPDSELIDIDTPEAYEALYASTFPS